MYMNVPLCILCIILKLWSSIVCPLLEAEFSSLSARPQQEAAVPRQKINYMSRQVDYISWLHMMAKYAPFRLQLGEFNMSAMWGHSKPFLVSMNDSTLYKLYGMNFCGPIAIPNNMTKVQTHSSSAEDNRTQYVRMVHELILSWKFGRDPVLLIWFTYTSCWKFAFALFLHINGYSKAFTFLFLNNMCLCFMWNVRCWKVIFVLSDIIHAWIHLYARFWVV